MTKCTLCGDKIDLEHPDGGGRALNPETFRWGYIHNWCLVEAITQLPKARKEKYDDKFLEECL